jgi:lipoprotein-releasing system permease protein
VQLRLADVHDAARRGHDLQASLGPSVIVRDWTRTNRNWYDAVQIEKRLMFIILTLIVAVAAFNLVSTLVMTVTDKQSRHRHPAHAGRQPALHHGHLHRAGRHLGHHRHAGGVALGLGVAFNIDVIVPAIERAFGVAFLPGSIYVISRMPSQPLAADIVPVTS